MPTVAKVGSIVREDPVLRYSPKGVAYLKFSIKVEDYDYEKREKKPAEFYEVTCFKDLAENVAASVKKGHRVIVRGEGKIEEFEHNGEKRTKKVITADACGHDYRFVIGAISSPDAEQSPTSVPSQAQIQEDLERPF